MLASAAALPASVARYLAIAPSVFRLPSPASMRSAVSSMEARAGFQPRHVRHDQLVRVALLLGQRRAGLDALGGVGDRAVERGPSGAEPERRHHQPRVAEHLLRLDEPLALDAADQPVGVDIDVVEEQRRGVAQADAVLVLRLAVGEALRALLDHEPARARRARWPGSCKRRRRRRC